MKKKKDFSAIYQKIRDNQLLLCSEYAEHMIVVPWVQRWKYAIPENYTNYQGEDAYRDVMRAPEQFIIEPAAATPLLSA